MHGDFSVVARESDQEERIVGDVAGLKEFGILVQAIEELPSLLIGDADPVFKFVDESSFDTLRCQTASCDISFWVELLTVSS